MRKPMLSLLLALLLCCTACAQKQEPASGVPTLEDVAEMEAMYGMKREELMEALGVAAGELTIDQEEFIYFPANRTIQGAPVTESAFFVLVGEPYMGVWMFQLTVSLEGREDAGEALQAVYDEAASLYGEPSLSTPKGESAIEGVKSTTETHYWTLGKQTQARLILEYTEDLSRAGFSLVYQMLPVVP